MAIDIFCGECAPTDPARRPCWLGNMTPFNQGIEAGVLLRMNLGRISRKQAAKQPGWQDLVIGKAGRIRDAKGVFAENSRTKVRAGLFFSDQHVLDKWLAIWKTWENIYDFCYVEVVPMKCANGHDLRLDYVHAVRLLQEADSTDKRGVYLETQARVEAKV